MRWSKLKTAVIVLLLAANVFFALKIADLSRDRTDEITKQSDGALIEVLKNDGIILPPELIGHGGAMTAFVCDPAGDYTFPVREKLTGTTDAVYDKRESGIRTVQVGDGSRFVFGSDGSFEMLRLEYDVLVDSVLADDNMTAASADTASAVKAMLTDVFVPKGGINALSLTLGDVRLSGSTGCIVAGITETVVYTADGASVQSELYGNKLTCIMLDGKLIYASGKWLFSPVTEAKTAQSADIVNILLSVKKAVSASKGDGKMRTVTSVGHTYCAYASISGGVSYVMPGHSVTFDDGTRCVVNSLNAELYH